MLKKPQIDPILCGIIFLLLLIGTIILFSVSAHIGEEKRGDTFYYLKHQALFGFLFGSIIALVVFKIDINLLKKYSHFFFLFTLLLSSLVFLPHIGLETSGAKRWISIGSFSFQPTEFLKISLPLYLAVWLTKKKRDKAADFFGFLLILLPVVLILCLQPDYSTLLLLLFMAFLVYFLSGTPLSHIIAMAALGISFCLIFMVIAPYRMRRIMIFLHPHMDPMDAGFQKQQSLIAIGSGGIWGKGLGLSTQKFGFVPNVISDSIFPVFCEEAGFIGGGIVVLLFLLFLIRVIMLAKRKKDHSNRALISALGAGIVAQAFLNMSALIGLLPLTGVPLPFISYGGTHLLVELGIIGLIFNLLRS